MATVENIHRYGASADRPPANTVVAGTEYWDTDSGVLSQSDGQDWSIVFTSGGGGAGAWELIATDLSISSKASSDFTGLAGYTDIMVVIRNVTAAASGFRAVRVSTDNGSSFLSSSGDYINMVPAGTESNTSQISAHDTAAATARSGIVLIRGFNLTAPKTVTMPSRDSTTAIIIPTANALNAVQVVSISSAGNLTGGDIYVFGKAA